MGPTINCTVYSRLVWRKNKKNQPSLEVFFKEHPVTYDVTCLKFHRQITIVLLYIVLYLRFYPYYKSGFLTYEIFRWFKMQSEFFLIRLLESFLKFLIVHKRLKGWCKMFFLCFYFFFTEYSIVTSGKAIEYLSKCDVHCTIIHIQYIHISFLF